MVNRLPWSPASCEGVVHGVGIGSGIRTKKAGMAQCPAARPGRPPALTQSHSPIRTKTAPLQMELSFGSLGPALIHPHQ